jgi:hypothetical protein
MTMKLQANEPGAKSFMKDQEEVLAIPTAISVHNAVSGWLRFHVTTAMLTNRAVNIF